MSCDILQILLPHSDYLQHVCALDSEIKEFSQIVNIPEKIKKIAPQFVKFINQDDYNWNTYTYTILPTLEELTNFIFIGHYLNIGSTIMNSIYEMIQCNLNICIRDNILDPFIENLPVDMKHSLLLEMTLEIALKYNLPESMLLSSKFGVGKYSIIEESRSGNLRAVKYMYNQGQSSLNSSLSIHVAASNGHLEVVKYFHSLGIKSPYFTMDKAGSNGYLEVVEYLHSIGYECTDRAIYMAARGGHLNVIQFFVSIGANINLDYRNNPMDNAASGGHLEVVKYLYSIGQQFTYFGFQWAQQKGHLDVLKYLQSI